MYFLALSILEIVPSPKSLCFTLVPTPTSARICSQSVCGFSSFTTSIVFTVDVIAFLFALGFDADLVSDTEAIVSDKSEIVACCFE